MDEYFTPYDVAGILHVPPARVARWARRGELPAIILPSGDLVIPAADLKAWLDSRRPRPAVGVSHA
jgi:hypothetical protein